MPVLHFSGKFRFFPPLYNNDPLQPEKYFDPNLTPEEVKAKVTGGVDPLRYFEFEFYDTYIRKVTYDDGNFVNNSKEEPIIGKELLLKGMLVDVSPHLIRGRLYAGELRVLDYIIAKTNIATQSDLFVTIRGSNANDIRNVSADFESSLYEVNELKNDFVSENTSKFIRESEGNVNLKLYFNLNSFDFKSLEGRVYGYIGPNIRFENEQEVRIQGRRLLLDPLMPAEIKTAFSITDSTFEPTDDIGRNDLEGTYEILEYKKLVILRYLNFMPFMDNAHTPFLDYTFSIVLLKNDKPIPGIDSIPIDIVSEESISRDGGVCIFRLPGNSVFENDYSDLSICIKVSKKDSQDNSSFLKEPFYDIMLKDNQKFLTLGSAKKSEKVLVRVYKKNKLARGDRVWLLLNSLPNDKSPKVVSWNDSSVSSDSGTVECSLQTVDLENCTEAIVDPIFPKQSEEDEPVKISGELPWDRYYGNYVSIKLNSDEKYDVQINIPVRVLHEVKTRFIESMDILTKEEIQDIVTKILSYYTRYYPWLHVRYMYARTANDNIIKPTYVQFLKIKEYLDFVSPRHIHGWHSAQGAIGKINHFLDRLERDEHDWRKMPRSRDFPINGTEFLKAWKSSLITKVVQEIDKAKEELLKKYADIDIDQNLDINDWGDVEKVVDKLNDLATLSDNLSNEQKRVVLTSKISIYNFMIEKLKDSTKQKGHSHQH
jgi:hypothetical protein